MSDIEVKIVRLEPMSVASFHTFGPSPEEAAWAKLEAWAKPRGFLDHPDHRIFGFNNPNPSHASPNYGYEFIIQVESGYDPGEGVPVKDFGGGLYAVSRLGDIEDPGKEISAGWERLYLWVEDSKYEAGKHQWLEEHITAPGILGWTLDLFFPLENGQAIGS